MNIKTIIYYAVGIALTVIIWGLNSVYFLFLLLGFGIGIFLYKYVKDMYDNTINAFFTGELRKREMKEKELELELEKIRAEKSELETEKMHRDDKEEKKEQ
jgi:hypothetical protein